MAIGDSAGLLFKIKSEYNDEGTKQFKKDLKDLDKASKEALTPLENLAANAGLSAKEFTNLKIGALAAIGVITAVTAAATGTALAMLELTKQAAAFGGAIKDVQDKTGLSAETLSTLKLNADQSGSSIEKVGGSVAKFNVLLGQAANGNQHAKDVLAQYGVTAKDTRVALDQAISSIGHMSDESRQAAASAALFRDRTGEMLPVIKQLNGDLAGATEQTKKLGLAMSQDAVEAADALDDQMTVLDAQLKMVGLTIGNALVPAVLDLAQTFSNFLSSNKADVASWAASVGNAVRNLVIDLHQYADGLRLAIQLGSQLGRGDFQGAIGTALEDRASGQHFDQLRNSRGVFGSAGGNLGGGGGRSPGGGGGGGRGGGGGSSKDDTVERARKLADDRLKVQQEKDKAQLAELKLMLEEGTITEQEEIQKRQEIEERFFDYKIGILKKEMDLIKGNAKETARLNTEITLTSLQKVVQVSKDKIEVLKQEAKEAQNNAAIWEQIVKREIELRGQALELEQHQLDVSKQLGIANAQQLGLSGLPNPDEDEKTRQHLDMLKNNPIGGLLDQFKDNQGATAVITSLADAFGQLGQAVGQTVEALVLYGNAGGNLRQVTAKILAAVASQAAVKAVFELAEGLACLALAFFGDPSAGAAAGMHFAAAAAYGAIAGVAGLAGRAVAGDSFKQGAAAGGGRGASAGSGSSTNTSPQSRVGATATDSGIRGTLDRLNSHLDRLEPMSPGDVLVRGANDRPGAVGNAAVRDIGRFPAIGKQFTVRQGIR